MVAKSQHSIPPLQTNIILESISDGVFTVNEDMKITFFNRAAEKITGISSEQAVGQYCFDVLKANICEKSCSLRSSLKSDSDVVDRRVNILRADGKQIPISISTAVLRDKTGKKIGGVETFRDLSSIEELEREIRRSYTLEDIISKNHLIQKIFDILPNIAESESTVLIQGPSGSGKELFARAIHNLSLRNRGPFIAINCGALPDTLLESELFGYLKGAFTDAKKNKPGRFALAQKGTMFLDEVESLSPAMQVKLLRVLQERVYEPLGAIRPVKADVRVVAATKDALSTLVEKGIFRDDLFFRLNVLKIMLPPLSERKDDIPMLIDHFISKFNHKMRKTIIAVSDDVMEILMQYNFPGNIRELENIIEHAFVMCREETIQISHLPVDLIQTSFQSQQIIPENTPLQNAEKEKLLETLEKHNWNKVNTAKELNIHRATLYRKIEKYGLRKINFSQ